MAVTTEKSAQLAADYIKRPYEDHGKLRHQYFKFTQGAAAGDANSTADLCVLPSGHVRIFPGLSRISTAAFGTGRTLDVGHRAYSKGSDTTEALDADAFIDGLDVASAVAGAAFGTSIKFDVYSTGGITVYATVLGGTIPAGTVIEGYMVYSYE